MDNATNPNAQTGARMTQATPERQRPLSRALRLLLIALLLALLMVLLPSGAIHSYAEILTLPWDENGGQPPLAENYLGETGYVDPSISIQIKPHLGRYKQTNYTTVEIKLQNGTQLRTLKAGPYGSTREAQGAVMAKRVQAVLAISGDFFSYHNRGYIVRQGVFYRNKATGEQDILIIDKKGDFDLLIRPMAADIEAYEAKHKADIAQAFTFGPALVKDGQRIAELTPLKGDPGKAQRLAFCQVDELTYLVVYAEGPNDKNSVGLSIPQFADLVASFKQVRTAYNLDGGSSATIAFLGKKINGPTSQRMRSIGDIIYFASAYQPD